MSKSRAKGTGEESATVKDWRADGFAARRTAASSRYDIEVPSGGQGEPIEVLTIRADRGERLAVLRHADLRRLFANAIECRMSPSEIHEEVKRYRTFAISTIFQKKFG